ncbi:hypothetical protein [Catenuloplanes indicus]|uniref:Uncharacterized protein n=1 Tax=Catenuloplanes indicus TaxID=137267 RepID=A0AAE3W1V3_9ACTN|nr:hypothetical protein [Catenuloplanes indicus]MDQ0366940.1 hypothetical protein [Catenuloplanes indicus]
MPAPTISPADRKAPEVRPSISYERDQKVWVFQRRWLPGAVEAASTGSVRVRHLVGASATGVDDFIADRVMHRTAEEAIDPQLETA